MSKRKRGGLAMGLILASLACLGIPAQPNQGDKHGHGPGHGNDAGSAPVASPDHTTTPQNTAVTINVLANDSDADHDINASTVDLDTQAPGIQATATTPKGAYAVDATGVVSFTPTTNVTGPATIAYTVSDSTALVSNPANITIDVQPVAAANTPPVANNDTGTTVENQDVTIDALANDTDSDGTLDTSKVDLNLTQAGVQKSINTAQGNWSADRGKVKFRPKDNFVGTASIDYVVYDDDNAPSNSATITVSVTAENKIPVAVNDNAGTAPGTPVNVNVVANDTDADGTIDPTKVDLNTTQAGVQSTASNASGTWEANAQGIVTYTPAAAFTGDATLAYTVMDNSGAVSNSATIKVTVTVNNIAPVAANDTGGTTINKPVDVNVVANDTDADGTIDVTKVDLNTNTAGVQNTINTAQGSWKVNSAGVVTYTPIALFLGNATLNYTVMDNKGAVSNEAKITISVQAVNIAPVANNDNVTTTKNKAVSIKVTQNDTDVDGSIDESKVDINTTLAGIQNTATTEQGEYTVNNQGSVTFTPANNFTGVAALTYTVADNAGATSNEATLTITVQNVNSAPVAVNDTGATSANTSVTVNVVSNDTDSDGVIDAAKVDLNTNTAGIQSTRDTPQGDFSVNNIGIVTYVPAKDFTGSATVTYAVSDNNGAMSNVATITIAVQPLNAPVANEDRATTNQNTAVTINVVANDRDTDGSIDATTVDLDVSTNGSQKNNTTQQGSFVVDNNGVVTFTPKKDYFGLASLQYTVKDNKGILSNPASINITVEETPNDAPKITVFEQATDTLRYTPGNPIEITDVFEATDDSDSLALAEIGFVSETYASGMDKLLFEGTNKIKGTFNQQTGLLTLRGGAPIGDYIAAVRSVKYQFTGTNESRNDVKYVYVRVSDGNKFSDTKQRAIKINSAVRDLDIPTAFTPNSDGANDTWRILAPTDISGSDFADAEIRVFDKRGTVVFGANGLNNTWDGTYQGKQLPVDTYYYTIDLKQKQKRYKGIVAILR